MARAVPVQVRPWAPSDKNGASYEAPFFMPQNFFEFLMRGNRSSPYIFAC